MGKVNVRVELLRSSHSPEEVIAMAAKLCYSGADLDDLRQGIEAADQSAFMGRLIELGHYSPVEHVSFTFLVEGVSRVLLAQITRHRLASFSVQSQRYVRKKAGDGAEVFNYVIPPAIEALGSQYVQKYCEQMEKMQEWYDEWVGMLGDNGEQSNEDARFILPNAAETKLMVTMNARELLHFFNLRCCSRAQWEIRQLADEMLKLVRQTAPLLFGKAGPFCLSGHCHEGKMTCGHIEEVREKYREMK